MAAVRRLTGVFVCISLSWAAPASADVVFDWYMKTQATIAATVGTPAARPGPSSLLDLAGVHAAMHDAIQLIERDFETYSGMTGPRTGSPVAAAAAAAHRMLVHRFPAQATELDAFYQQYLTANNLTGTEDGVGAIAGRQAADAIIVMRAGDGSSPAPTMPPTPAVTGENAIGKWRSATGMPAPWLGSTKPFTLRSSDQMLPEPPPLLTSLEYAEAYNEVKRFGAKDRSSRSADQSETARFFSEGAQGYWNRTLETLATEHGLGLGDKARLFALVQLAMADSIITAWNSKSHFNFWRPITAIRYGADDGNLSTSGDSTWEPLLPTPNYPDYTSGANNIGGSAAYMVRLYFGTDHMEFKLKGAAGVDRPYKRFSDVAADLVDARIYQGIHFRFADTVARSQGQRVARWAFRRFLRPVDDPHVVNGDDSDLGRDAQ